MTWLSEEDRATNAQFQAAGEQAFNHASSQRAFTHVVVMTQASYPHVPERINIALPHGMDSQQAKDYVRKIGYRKVEGFLDAKHTFYRNISD